MTNQTSIYTIRDVTEGDKAFVLATFLRGLYYGDSWFTRVDKDIFMANYHPIAEAMYNKCVVKVACVTEDPNVIIGYSILSQDYLTINWVHVKKDWRNKGVGRDLVPKHPQSVSHLSDLGFVLLKKFFPNTIFNPWRM